MLVVASLPGYDPSAVIEAERDRWNTRRAEAESSLSAPSTETASTGGEVALQRLAIAADAARAVAALDWLDVVARAATSDRPLAFAPTDVRPRRGRRPGRTEVADQESVIA